ncbi:MAG: hypothetical protein KKA64_03270 [Nanoarchaeota archaeon]|nr:hypothetical protein [Nanoarchaeota archaeon]
MKHATTTLQRIIDMPNAEFFYSPIMRVGSDDYNSLIKSAINDSAKYKMNSRDLIMTVKPIHPLKFKILEVFMEYKRI